MWAFAVWDRRRRQLLLARDRMGVKPLYYARVGPRLVFASEIKAVLASGLPSTDLDPAALAAYLECQYVPGPRTIFGSVRKLEPGCALVADPSGIRIERFWNPSYRLDRVPAFPEAAAELRRLMADSIRLRLMSEVPLGAFLSGGLDSSIVVGLMTEVSGRPVKTFTIGFPGKGWHDESVEAERVARHFGAEHHPLPLEAPDLPSTLEQVVWALDEPLADPAAIPTHLLARLARRSVTVALTGEGADELFGGYDHFRFELLLSRLGGAGGFIGRIGSRLLGAVRSRQAQRALQAAALEEPERHLRVRATLDRDEVAALLPGFDPHRPRATREALEAAGRRFPGDDPVNRLLFQDAATWLPDDLLMKVDKMTMLASVEARVPFLDYRVVEYLFSLPGSYKIRGGRGKRILRSAFGDLLPGPTLRRRKHGFALPLGDWLRRDLRSLTRDLFASPHDPFSDYIDRRAVERILDEFYRDGRDHALVLWILLNLKIWCRQLVQPASVLTGTAS